MRPYVLAALTASTLALGACADGDGGTLYVAGIVVPSEECELPDNPDAFQSAGRVNVDLASGFTLTPLVVNGVLDASGLNDSTAPPNAVNVIGADVSLLNADDQLLDVSSAGPHPYFVTATAGVAGNDAQPMAFDAIPRGYLLAAADAVGLTAGATSIVLGVQLRGRTVGGESVISPEFKYTVNLFRTATPGLCPDGVTVACAFGDDAEVVAACPRVGQDRTAVLDASCAECGGTSGVFCLCN